MQETRAVFVDEQIQEVMDEGGWPLLRLQELQDEAGAGVSLWLTGDMSRRVLAYVERRVRELDERVRALEQRGET